MSHSFRSRTGDPLCELFFQRSEISPRMASSGDETAESERTSRRRPRRRTTREQLRKANPLDIIDHSIPESATTTPFGHTPDVKIRIFRKGRAFGFRDVAVVGHYYGSMPRVEDRFAQLLRAEEPRMSGCWFMLGTGDDEALARLEASGIPNVMLDYTFAGARTGSSSLQSLQTTIGRIHEHFRRLDRDVVMAADNDGMPHEDSQPSASGYRWLKRNHLYINFVDLLDSDVSLDAPQVKEVIDSLTSESTAILKGICFEGGLGNADIDDYAEVTSRLRLSFPSGDFKLLVHSHAAPHSDSSQAMAWECVRRGADGIWAGFIPQAAQTGHNCSMQYLGKLHSCGNGIVREIYKLDTAVQTARSLHELSFPGEPIPPDCPVFGSNAYSWVHSVFRHDRRTPRGLPPRAVGATEGARLAPMTTDVDVLVERLDGLIGNDFSSMQPDTKKAYALGVVITIQLLLTEGHQCNFNDPDNLRYIYQHVDKVGFGVSDSPSLIKRPHIPHLRRWLRRPFQDARLRLLYRSTRDGDSFADLMGKVGSAHGLLFAVKNRSNKFGVFFDGSLNQPSDPTSTQTTRGELFFFSLSGSFPQPTQIHPPQGRQRVEVAGRDGAVLSNSGTISSKIFIAGAKLWLGFSRSSTPSPSILSCHQWIPEDITPPGFTGTVLSDGDNILADRLDFTADVIEVYQVVRGPLPAMPTAALLPLPIDFPKPLPASALSSPERTCRTPA
ncbi:unnamed protein product [Vitrella brassicaformis CCMP3155]|uniref:TLDc domain-containing protein n=1 Tax=Vitrella brassicaformis (strain CCMP3155) TaxID=1169540 RepID=A0A0G4GIM1_VITBC|nr:unnamed protein product [Vitrella brassicaformis CCMP3155]|eukprot:CEM29686.1 unnamed protein product [Vitrella brassicaformis CCMP3155]